MPTPTPTTGLGVATTVSLTGAGVVQTVPFIAGFRGVSEYSVSIAIGSSVAITATPIDDSGAAVAAAPGGGGSPSTPEATYLATAFGYDILAGSAITGSAGAGSVVSGGNIGIYPNNASSVTNFPPSQLVAPGVFHYADPAAIQAQLDNTAAYNYYAGLATTQTGLTNLSANDGGGGVGVYRAGVFSGTALDIPTSITLDAQGNAQAIFVFISSSTTKLESGASVNLANGAQAGNVYWVVGSSFTSVWNGISSNMVGTILALTSITLGGGTLTGRALAQNGAVTIATTEVITFPTLTLVPGTPVPAGFSPNNAVTYNSAPISVPGWYKPSTQGKNYSNTYMAPAVVDDNDGNPWTVRGRFAGQTVIEFQIPTFENNEGTHNGPDVNSQMDETPIDMIYAHLLVTVTGGTS